jgi:hypothetical protein
MAAAAPTKTKKTTSSSSSRKTTARSSTKTKGSDSPEAKAIEELRDKRAEFDQPIVDTPVAVLEGGETVALDSDDRIEIVPLGSSVEVSLGGKTVTLDGEGVHSLQRHLARVAVGM